MRGDCFCFLRGLSKAFLILTIEMQCKVLNKGMTDVSIKPRSSGSSQFFDALFYRKPFYKHITRIAFPIQFVLVISVVLDIGSLLLLKVNHL